MSDLSAPVEKFTFWQRLGRIDRRIVYVVLSLVVLVPLIVPLRLMKEVSPRAREVFNAIDTLKDTGKPLMISVDFDPASLPELYPMLISMIRHAFARNVKVLILGLWPNGTGLGQQALNQAAQEFNKKNGEDYVFLGYKAGVDAVILGMGENIKAVFPKDGNGQPTDSLPMMSGIKKLADIGFIVSLSAGTPGYGDWLLYAQSRYHAKLGVGSTAVQAADAYPYLQTGQITGLLAGMKGAAEYEFLNDRSGTTRVTYHYRAEVTPDGVLAVAPPDPAQPRRLTIYSELVEAFDASRAKSGKGWLTLYGLRDSLEHRFRRYFDKILIQCNLARIRPGRVDPGSAQMSQAASLTSSASADAMLQALDTLDVTMTGNMKMTAAPAMDPQSLAHVAIIVLVILGNIGFFADRRRRKV